MVAPSADNGMASGQVSPVDQFVGEGTDLLFEE